MARAFAKISFTPDVVAAQLANGTEQSYRGTLEGIDEVVALGLAERSFIESMDSFYQATVSTSGWPYVQHRGGSKGFVKVIDQCTIEYPDYSGNGQYISLGNLAGSSRVAIIMMDYSQQRRLKLWGLAHASNNETHDKERQLVSAPAVERTIRISVQAFDWNCPQHIPVKYSEAEVDELIEQVRNL